MLILDVSTQAITAAFQLMMIVLIAVLGFISRAVYIYLKDLFGGGQLKDLLECLHKIAHRLDEHVDPQNHLHSHFQSSSTSIGNTVRHSTSLEVVEREKE